MFKRSLQILASVVRTYSNLPYKICYNMNVAYFRHLPESDQLQIHFRYVNSIHNVDRDFNFSRNINENVKVCLDRIKNNIEKELNKKNNKKRSKKNEATQNSDHETPVSQVLVQLIQNNNVVNDETTFALLLKVDLERNKLILKIVDDEFEVRYNTPWVANLTLPTSILAGFLLYPRKLELLFAQKENSTAIWYKGLMPKSKNVRTIEWQKLHEGLTYNTTTNDIGYLVKLELIPGDGKQFGPPVECISKSEIEAGPGICPFENRHKFTEQKLNGDKFRVMSYNILADLYADSDYTRKELFPYCPPYALTIDYRKQLFLKEILGYKSDIICLQEVDSKIFDLDITPVFKTYSYSGDFQEKGKSGEGLSILYDNIRFELVKKYGFTIGENIAKLDIFKSLWTKINTNQDLAKRIENRSTAIQVSLLRSRETDHYFLVANTHLYFHPDADHIRLLQIGFSMIYLEDLYQQILQEIPLDKSQISIIFCGDFNSVPECGIYKLMTEKHVDDTFVDWSSKATEAVKCVELTQSFNIESACGCPKYTNFTTLFAACLDYIFYQTDNLKVVEVIPLPTEEELTAHAAIPSVVFPSDHIALVADLKLRTL